MPKIPFPILRIVCFGDSITGPQPGTRYLDRYLKWSDLLQFVLETDLGTGNVEVLNRGWAGSTSIQAVERVEKEVLAIRPDLVVVLIGGNDFGPGADMQQASEVLQRNLTDLVVRFKEAGMKILLLQYHQPSSDFRDKVWRHLDAGNPAIAEVASREDVPTLKLAPAFAEAAQTHPLAELLNPDDGVHLNPYGEIVLARTLFFRLRELGWVPEKSSGSVPVSEGSPRAQASG